MVGGRGVQVCEGGEGPYPLADLDPLWHRHGGLQARGTYNFISQLLFRHTVRNAFMNNSFVLWRRELGMPVFPLAFPSSLLSAYVFDVMTRQPRKRLGSKVNFLSTRGDTVHFAFVYHRLSKVHKYYRFYWTFWNNRSWMFKVNALHVFQNQGKYSITFHTRQLLSKH